MYLLTELKPWTESVTILWGCSLLDQNALDRLRSLDMLKSHWPMIPFSEKGGTSSEA